MWKNSQVSFLKGDRPLVMAHRGDSANIPENTLQAYEDAYNLKVDVIETDLRIAKDNEIIFFHDKTVNRTTNGLGSVRSFTLQEIKKLDQGYRFKSPNNTKNKFPFRGKGLQIQSLEEILQKYPDMRFNMDIKDTIPIAAIELAKKLRVLDAEERVMVGSFHHKQLKLFRKHSSAPTSASPIEVFQFRQRIRKWIKKTNIASEKASISQKEIFGKKLPYYALQIPEKLSVIRVFKDLKFITASHKLDIAIHVWTINNKEDMIRLLDWGVDGIFSDKPKLLQEIIQSKFIN